VEGDWENETEEESEQSKTEENDASSSEAHDSQEGNALFGFQDLCLRQELLEYMGVHDNDASESSQPSWGKMCTSGTVSLDLMLPCQSSSGSSVYYLTFAWFMKDQFCHKNLLKIGMWFGGKMIQKTSPKKGVFEESPFLRHAARNWGEVNSVHAYYNGSCTDNEDPSWSTSFKDHENFEDIFSFGSALEDI
ncbi:hypothetical protein Tco_0327316, partial [Tanacetum coccineum]